MRLLGCLVVASALVGCVECDIVEEARSQAGGGARDCGHVGIGESRVEAHACTVESFEAGRGFYAVFDEQGIDSQVARAVAGNRSGDVWLLSYDSGCCGDQAEARITRQRCREPVVATVTEALEYGDQLPPGAVYLGCGSLDAAKTVCDD